MHTNNVHVIRKIIVILLFNITLYLPEVNYITDFIIDFFKVFVAQKVTSYNYVNNKSRTFNQLILPNLKE